MNKVRAQLIAHHPRNPNINKLVKLIVSNYQDPSNVIRVSMIIL
jgi:hypothetical protein